MNREVKAPIGSTLAAALVFHAAVLAMMPSIGEQVAQEAEQRVEISLEEPPEESPPPPPPPPPAPASAPQPRPEPQPEPEPEPDAIEPEPEPEPEPLSIESTRLNLPAAAYTGLPEGVVGGQIGGQIGGKVTAPAPPPAPPPPPPPPPRPQQMNVNPAVMQTQILKQVNPEYPNDARRFRIQGTVKLQAVVGTDGKIRSLQVLDGHAALVDAAVNAVKQWEYRPRVIGGKAFEVVTQIDVKFGLKMR